LTGLATAAAGQFADEAMWQLPARFPGDFAMGLAAQLSPQQGGSDMDLRQAQMMLSLPHMLDELESKASPTSIAATVLSSRTRRVDAMTQRERERHLDAFAQANVQAHEALEEAREAKIGELQAQLAKSALEVQLEAARSAATDNETKLAEAQMRHRRVLGSIALISVACAFPIVGVVSNNSIGTLVGLISLVGMATISVRWSRDLSLKLSLLAWTLIVDGVGLASAVLSLLNPGQGG
jgi:hypothetical protein